MTRVISVRLLPALLMLLSFTVASRAQAPAAPAPQALTYEMAEIGRASCRERV